MLYKNAFKIKHLCLSNVNELTPKAIWLGEYLMVRPSIMQFLCIEAGDRGFKAIWKHPFNGVTSGIPLKEWLRMKPRAIPCQAADG